MSSNQRMSPHDRCVPTLSRFALSSPQCRRLSLSLPSLSSSNFRHLLTFIHERRSSYGMSGFLYIATPLASLHLCYVRSTYQHREPFQLGAEHRTLPVEHHNFFFTSQYPIPLLRIPYHILPLDFHRNFTDIFTIATQTTIRKPT